MMEGDFEWLTTSAILIPHILSILHKEFSSLSSESSFEVTLVDLGVGTSTLAVQLREAILKRYSHIKSNNVKVVLVDNNEGATRRLERRYSADNDFVKVVTSDLCSTHASSWATSYLSMPSPYSQALVVALDKSTLDFLISSSASHAGGFLHSIANYIRPSLYICVSFHSPSFLLKVLQSVFTITSTSYVPRSSNHLRASEALQLSESPTWNKEGTFQPDACYRNAVSVYLCKDIMSEEAAKQLSKNHLEKRLGEVVEQYFTQVAPMLTELKYHSLKESWGDPSTLKALQQAFYLMFPDESLREVYSCDDFREDYASWRMSKAERCCNQHKGQRDLICFDEAIAFLSEMQ